MLTPSLRDALHRRCGEQSRGTWLPDARNVEREYGQRQLAEVADGLKPGKYYRAQVYTAGESGNESNAARA